MMEQVQLLLKALRSIQERNVCAEHCNYEIQQIVEDTLNNVSRLEEVRVRPVQWNKSKPPQDARECNDHPAVRNTDYMEVHHLTGTSGCAPAHPHWTWPVLGVLEDATSKQLVVPGDWIFELSEGKYVVVHADQYEAIFGERPARKLSKEELYNAGSQLFINAQMGADEYLSKFEEGVGKLNIPGRDELTNEHVETILMTMFGVDRADLVEAADARAKVNAAQKLEVERLHCK